RCGSSPSIFCFHDTTATVIYTLSLHDALPILLNATLTVRAHQAASHQRRGWEEFTDQIIQQVSDKLEHVVFILWGSYAQRKSVRSEEHTSELQSRENLVCRLLLEKKKKKKKQE